MSGLFASLDCDSVIRTYAGGIYIIKYMILSFPPAEDGLMVETAVESNVQSLCNIAKCFY